MADDDKKETVEVDNRPASQIDLERRLANNFEPERVSNTDENWANPEVVQASFVGDGNDTTHFKGVGQEYMNYASVEGQPFEPDEGPEAESIKRLQGGVAAVRKTQPPADREPAVGVDRLQTLNTAASGEGYTAGLVDAEPDYNGGPAVIMPDNQTPAVDAAPKAPAKKAASPAKPSSNS